MSDPITSPEDTVKTPAGEAAKDVLGVVEVANAFNPEPFTKAVIVLIAKYGPGIIDRLEVLFSKPQITLADFRAVFADLQPWDAFGIPDKAPVPPITPAPGTVTVAITPPAPQ